MEYREWALPAGLADQVEAIWTLSGHAGPGGEPQRILPDGCAELVLNFADPVIQETRGPLTQPRLMFVGQITGPLQIRPTGRVDMLGVRFRPGGAAALTPVPQHELVDQSVALTDIAKAAAIRLESVFDTQDTPERIDRTAHALRASLDSRRSAVTASADALVRHWGMIPVGVLAAGAGMGARQLERRFLEEVGVSPKHLARISRFQRVFHAVEEQPSGWARIAADCGYYDSSHLVRDFREFAGEAPSRALAELDGLTMAFTRANRRTV